GQESGEEGSDKGGGWKVMGREEEFLGESRKKGGAANMEGHHAAGSVGDEMKAKGERKVGRGGDAAKNGC
ncbi:hypothetical protein, partial [Adlercreutzia rubneri]|uniref:hypothetical protein n=1 Tax=Adlercreutzia rubneri TaxID=2916441 RepID=UPI001E50C954